MLYYQYRRELLSYFGIITIRKISLLILYGDSGENWAALSGKNENFQRILLERAERERKQ